MRHVRRGAGAEGGREGNASMTESNPTMTSPDELRERVAERLASWGISYVPQRSDDPIYDRLADRVVSDVVAPELERRDAERDEWKRAAKAEAQGRQSE